MARPKKELTGQGVYDRGSAWQVRVKRQDAAGNIHRINRTFPYNKLSASVAADSRAAVFKHAAAFAATRPNFVGLIYGGLRSPVPSDASPAFIAGAADDEYQPNDPILLYQAWRKAGVEAEVHVYERGGHGFDLGRQGTTSDLWLNQFIQWIKTRRPANLSDQGNSE
ncbi:hypothetical protein [Stenotrophomonas sp. PA-6-5C]|uniref:alpha/beta hydrolase n=1 Tax=Stenotrophomonas sp. PA-6-5C TaxID=2665487 RepID=UPI001F307F74|nr:hypothetical protein [Stenotrophomonas sp. PA-6-5C]